MCPGCRFEMSFTEMERGQTYCNRCESMLYGERPRVSRSALKDAPVPEFAPAVFLLDWEYGRISN